MCCGPVSVDGSIPRLSVARVEWRQWHGELCGTTDADGSIDRHQRWNAKSQRLNFKQESKADVGFAALLSRDASDEQNKARPHQGQRR